MQVFYSGLFNVLFSAIIRASFDKLRMTNTHTEYLHLLRSLIGGVLTMGIVLVGTSTSSLMTAQVSGQGATMFTQSEVHAAAFMLEARPDLRAQLLVGMLLILLGFTLYTMWVVRMRPVRVRRVVR